MKKPIYWLLCCSIVCGCNIPTNKPGNISSDSSSLHADTALTAPGQQGPQNIVAENLGTPWADSLIMFYVQNSKNEQLQASLKDSSLSWIYDRIENTDSATYLVCNLGTHVSDEGGMNPRFVNSQWLYIDTINRQLYEYDLPADSLVKWIRK